MILGTIYKIERIGGKASDKCYVGSTAGNSDKRFSVHKCYYAKNYHNGNLSSKVVFDKYGIENCRVVVIEKKNFESKDKMRIRETELMKALNACNKRVPHIKNHC